MAKRRPKHEIARKPRGRIDPIELALIGSSDGVPVELTGHGKFGARSSRLTLEIAVARSLLLFDPALVAIGVLDVLALVALGSNADPQAHVDSPAYVRTRTDLYDENGREAGGWRVVAALGRERGGCIRFDGQLLDCRQWIELGERVVAVGAPWTVMAQPLEPEGALLAGAWEARSGRGNGNRGVTTTLVEGHAWPWNAQSVAKIELQDIQVQRATGTAGELVTLSARLSR